MMFCDMKDIWRPAPNVGTVFTSRQGGVSGGDYESLNLAAHVGDDEAAVADNRARVAAAFPEVRHWQWLKQVHGTKVCSVGADLGDGLGNRSPFEGEPVKQGRSPTLSRWGVDAQNRHPALEADGLHTGEVGVGLCVLTADCLPVLLAAVEPDSGLATEVGILHAGWRGLAGGVVEAGVARFRSPASRLSAFLGPAIGPCHYEVGEEVYDAFREGMPTEALQDAFTSCGSPVHQGKGAGAGAGTGTGTGTSTEMETKDKKYMADLHSLARWCLQRAGVERIDTDSRCTYCHPELFYSHRRDGVCGRMLSAIYLRSL